MPLNKRELKQLITAIKAMKGPNGYSSAVTTSEVVNLLKTYEEDNTEVIYVEEILTSTE